MQLFYHPDITEDTSVFSFDAATYHHIVKVLRKSEGDLLYITNGKGWLFTATITHIHTKRCTVTITNAEQKTRQNYYLHLAVAPTKSNERYEWFLEKAVEIGVHEITPLICSHSERKHIKPERFRKIIAAAMQQSLQYYLPKFNEAVSFRNFIKSSFNGQLFMAHCGNSKRFSLKESVLSNHIVTVLIGPEGDFSEEEIQSATKKGFIPVSLGNTRLRTETAAIATCHTLALINE